VTREVPFLTRKEIENEANVLLASYGAKYGALDKPPIPADEILNVHLKVALDFDNLSKLLNVDSDVFGATWLERRQVVIDESLDPTNHPEMVGRYNFTVGHETGHWQLHRNFFEENPNQQQLFEHEQLPTVVCRTSEAKERIEWQADFFSSCFLMPKQMVEQQYRAKHGFESASIDHIRKMISTGSRNLATLSDEALIERFAKPLSRQFAVSPIAMRIRLETLGMIVRTEPPRLFALRSS
jgi:Zn-dependent peptidase ImmA (M78 family)